MPLFCIFLEQLSWVPIWVGKGKASKKAKPEPTKEELHAVVVDILKKVDFNTVSGTLFLAFTDEMVSLTLIMSLTNFALLIMQATLSDILRQLGNGHVSLQ